MKAQKTLIKVSPILFLGIVFLALLAMVKLEGSPWQQLQLLISASLVYLVWALWHHKVEKSLNKEIMIEYVLIAALSLVILLSLLV